jgi:sodium-dependent dicarboxylate transporter 2/3/5
MTWHDVNRLPWGVLVLFGGGLSLAAAVSGSGLAQWLGESLTPLSIFGTVALVLATTLLVIFLTELTSNLATAATFLPVMGAIALESGISPLVLCVPVTLAASCAFMLPVATPPNAIVFASGMITIPNMIRAGAILNFIGMLVLCSVAIWWAPFVFGV